MENLTQRCVEARDEFIKSNASEKSVENLYDIIYSLEEIEERNFEENFLLAYIYDIVGKNISASKIVRALMETAIEDERLKYLHDKLKTQDNYQIKRYRDLRDSKIIKEPTELRIEDLIAKELNLGSYPIKISDRVKNIVLFNKNMSNSNLQDCFVSNQSVPKIIKS